MRSGFEMDIGKQRRVSPVMEGVNDLGDGTTLSFHPQAFKDQGPHTLQKLEVHTCLCRMGKPCRSLI